MHIITGSISLNLFGVSYTQPIDTEADMAIPFSPGVSPAKPGVLTVRTDNNTGSLTMETGHGIPTGAILDVYWVDDGTGVTGCRRGMVVGTVAGLVVPIDLGAGDNLPNLNSVITAAVPHEESLVVTGNNVVTIVAQAPSTSKAIVSFVSVADAELFAIVLDAGTQYVWNDEIGITNPLAGAAVTKVRISLALTTVDDPTAVNGCVAYN